MGTFRRPGAVDFRREAAMVPLLTLTRYTRPAQHVLIRAEQQALADGDPAISTGDMLLACCTLTAEWRQAPWSPWDYR
ncbi:MAG: hypothetical protein JO132_05275 [Streptosporangiaceae bacterium]|nr:hypothetical protein [Streptosporangiaceae bacterium]